MAIEFYDVKTRAKVSVDDSKVTKTTFNTKNGQTRYGLRGLTDDNRPLTKFVSKGDWDSFKFPEAQPSTPAAKDAKSAPATKDAKSAPAAAPKKTGKK